MSGLGLTGFSWRGPFRASEGFRVLEFGGNETDLRGSPCSGCFWQA